MEPERKSEQSAEPAGHDPDDAPESETVTGAEVELRFDEQTATLTAMVAATDEPVFLDLDTLQRMIDEQGFTTFNFEANALTGVLRHVQNLEYGEYRIATRLDAEIGVSATADRLQALLTTAREYGGLPVTEQRIRDALRSAGVPDDLVVDSAIAVAVEQGVVNNLPVAKGVAPVSGTDSRVEQLVDLDREIWQARENDQGRVDHYSVRDFVIVEPGTQLLRRHPSTRGIAGRDVFGKAIAARDGKDVPLPKDMPGVVPDDQDPDLLVAEYRGHPVAIPGGMRVDKSLLLPHVDLRTGNVDFDGSVMVAGDVAAGVLVKATGDITVKGTVENSFLEAGGDLAVAHGITGSESAMQGGARDVSIVAGGSIHAGFASGVRLRAGADVVVKEYLNHCEAYASGHVLVGQKGGRGVIVGGRCHGCRGVHAQALGSPANVLTHISVGSHAELQQNQSEARRERDGLVARLDQLKAMLASMLEDGADERDNLVDKVRRTITDFERRMTEVDGRIDSIAVELEKADESALVCDQRAYRGVLVEIGEALLALRSDSAGGRFTCLNGEIECS